MGKVIGLLLAVVGIWITVELYTQGVDRAFGGRLAARAGADAAPSRGTTTQRVRDAVGRAQQEHEARYDELMPE